MRRRSESQVREILARRAREGTPIPAAAPHTRPNREAALFARVAVAEHVVRRTYRRTVTRLFRFIRAEAPIFG